MAPISLQDAPRANDRKGIHIDSCRRRRRHRRALRALFLNRRSFRPPVLKQRTQTEKLPITSALRAKVAVLGWTGGDSRNVNNLARSNPI